MTTFDGPWWAVCEKNMGHLWWRRVANLQTSSVTSDKATCEEDPQRAELHGSTSANLVIFSLQLQDWHLTSLRNPQHHLGRLMLVAHIPILLGQRPFSTDWPLIHCASKVGFVGWTQHFCFRKSRFCCLNAPNFHGCFYIPVLTITLRNR